MKKLYIKTKMGQILEVKKVEDSVLGGKNYTFKTRSKWNTMHSDFVIGEPTENVLDLVDVIIVNRKDKEPTYHTREHSHSLFTNLDFAYQLKRSKDIKEICLYVSITDIMNTHHDIVKVGEILENEIKIY